MITYVSQYITNHFLCETDTDELTRAKICYGLTVLIYNVVTISGILILSFLFQMLPQTCLFLAAFGLLRISAGGFHCNSYARCFVLTSMIILGGAYIANQIPVLPRYLLLILYPVMFLIGRNPVSRDRAGRVYSRSQLKRKRNETILLLFIYEILSLIYHTSIGKYITIAAVAAMFLLLPSHISRKPCQNQ